jgi:glutamate-1-semialdehyde 2,1-aminomutase
MKKIVFVQARLGSTRFPNKILTKYRNYTMLQILLNRLKLSKKIDDIVVIIPSGTKDKYLITYIKSLGFKFFLGSEKNVLKRYYLASIKYKADVIVRVTADCPLLDPYLLDSMMTDYLNSNLDYLSNTIKPTFPDGMDVEIFSKKTLLTTFKKAKSEHEREHVTPFIKNNNSFKKKNYLYKKDLSNLRITLDNREDLANIKKILNYFDPKLNFTLNDIIKLPKRIKSKLTIKRQDGTALSTGEKTWVRAMSVIPDGNMFLSKRPNIFLKKNWPIYFMKAKGCYIWDLDNNKYVDCSFMGVGTNILGYANNLIDNKVKKAIDNGGMSTLNSKDEVLLAEKLIDLHNWAEKVKFARTGGEANLLALRISRAYTQKYKVAFCGYHGWHDWYLSSNLKNSNVLNKHLLSDLKIEGVPPFLKNSSFAFKYNDFNQIEKIVKKEKNIGTIIMEVKRNIEPKDNFLKKIRKLCDENNIVLIFDECTSGFRETLGGLHQNFKVNPDIAVYGKAIGNGYPINAIVGKGEVMDSAKKTFISSTFWSERLGYVAALETINQMEKKKSWIYTKNTGLKIKNFWKKIFQKHKINAKIIGLDSIPSFIFKNNHELNKTFITKEMLKNNILATNSFYVSTAHTKKIINIYFKEFEKVIIKLKNIKNIKKETEEYLSDATFKRIN